MDKITLKIETMKTLKRNYVKLNQEILKAIKNENIEAIKHLMPKFYELQNHLIDLGVKPNLFNPNL
jgi:aminoglycoside phosphotransferase family enzyme